MIRQRNPIFAVKQSAEIGPAFVRNLILKRVVGIAFRPLNDFVI